MPEREVLGDEARLRSERRTKLAEDGHAEGEHDRTIAEVAGFVSGESARALG
jgi:hypothetical protein